MSRPRPRVEGRSNARTAGKSIQSQAPKDARLVPQQLSELGNSRALAARRILKSQIPQKTGETHTNRNCDGTLGDTGVE
jgi:hypothetical protein